MNKRVVFEGRIDGVYSQIFFDESHGQWFLMQKIKDSERVKAMLYAKSYNHGKAEEDKLSIETKIFNDKRSRFLVGRISERKATEFVKKNQGNQIRTETRIKDVPKYSEQKESFVKSKSKLVNVVKSPAFRKGAAIIASLLIAGAVFETTITPGSESGNSSSNAWNDSNVSISQKYEDPTIPEATQPECGSPQVEPPIELEDVVLETMKNGSLTSDSVKNLTKGIVNEISQLYKLAGVELPTFIDSETLISLFYSENTCKPVDDKDAYVGIGQMSKVAIKESILMADMLYNKALKNASLNDMRNYVVDNFCSMGQDIDELTNKLWEQSKTDASMCGTAAALYIGSTAYRYRASFGTNKNAVIMAYNAGEGNVGKYAKEGIVKFSDDYSQMEVDVSKVSKLSTAKQRSKYYEAESYVIKVGKGSDELKKDTDADVYQILENVRLAVGKNSNYTSTLNTQQYKFAPEGIKFVGYENANEQQPET